MPDAGTATLAFAVRKSVVVWLVGQLLLPMVGLALVPMAFALAFGEFGFAARCATLATAFLAAGWTMARIEAPIDVRPNEAMVATVLIFLIGATAMTWPLAVERMQTIDAWFESVSAITTTGLTTVRDVESHSPAFLLTRAWMQWYGGLAIVVLAIALILGPGVAARRLGETEAEVPDFVGSARTRARQALAVYLALTAFAFGFLALVDVQVFDALVYALSAVSTGGFSSHNDGLLGLGGPLVQWIPIAMSFCGAISLTLYVRAWQGRWLDTIEDVAMRALVAAMLATTLLVAFFMAAIDGQPWTDALGHASLLSVSAQSTAGFSSVDVGALDPASKLTLVGSMFVGGDPGSTAGGIKITRFLILLALVRHVIARTRLPPHAVSDPTLSGRRLEVNEVRAVVTIVTLHTIVVGLSWLVFVANGYDVLDALFEVTSAVGTVGLSTGVTSENLAFGLKCLLTADMLMGRLEVLAIIVLLNPMTWIGRRAEES